MNTRWFRASHPKLRLHREQLRVEGRKISSSSFWKQIRTPIVYVSVVGIISGGLYYLLVNENSRAAPTSSKVPMAPTHFTPVTVTSSISCTPYTKLLRLRLQPQTIPKNMPGQGMIYSVYVKDSDIQVERPYTPLEGIDENGDMEFWVKRYQGGEVGRWIHERKIGDQIEIRGPVLTWQWREEDWDEIIMISGGTGITPFYQLMYQIFADDRPKRTRFTLLHSSPTVSDLPPGKILDWLREKSVRESSVFRMQVYVDVLERKMGDLHVGRIDSGVIQRLFYDSRQSWWRSGWRQGVEEDKIPVEENRRILFLICGPEPMMTAMKGILRGRHVHKL